MLTNNDIKKIQEIEDKCILLAEEIAAGSNNNAILSAMISNLHFQTRKKLNKIVK